MKRAFYGMKALFFFVNEKPASENMPQMTSSLWRFSGPLGIYSASVTCFPGQTKLLIGSLVALHRFVWILF